MRRNKIVSYEVWFLMFSSYENRSTKFIYTYLFQDAASGQLDPERYKSSSCSIPKEETTCTIQRNVSFSPDSPVPVPRPRKPAPCSDLTESSQQTSLSSVSSNELPQVKVEDIFLDDVKPTGRLEGNVLGPNVEKTPVKNHIVQCDPELVGPHTSDITLEEQSCLNTDYSVNQVEITNENENTCSGHNEIPDSCTDSPSYETDNTTNTNITPFSDAGRPRMNSNDTLTPLYNPYSTTYHTPLLPTTPPPISEAGDDDFL